MDKKPLKLCFIDLETTGLDPKLHAIVQIAGIIEIDGVEKERFDFRVKPAPGKMLDQAALDVHGLTREVLDGYENPSLVHARLVTTFCRYVDKFNRADKFFFIGYNSRFDEDFLRQFFLDCGDKYYGSFFWTPSIDVMQIAAVQLMNVRHTLPNFQLGTVTAYMSSDLPTDLHNAAVDIDITRNLYRKLRGTNEPTL